MKKLFLWFYCLPISDAVLLIVLATVIFLFLREKYRNTPYWKIGIPILLTCWIAVILFGTLGQRVEGENLSEPILIPFYSYYTALNGGSEELYRTNFMNAVLSSTPPVFWAVSCCLGGGARSGKRYWWPAFSHW